MKEYITAILIVIASYSLQANEYHVSKKGNDTNVGSLSNPFLTISKAVENAFPGDTITVHEGVYREWVNPIRGGNIDNRIVYRAAKGEKTEIKGSEIIKGWEKVDNGVWKVIIPNSFFGDYNPFLDSISGDWFKDWGRIHHTGEVFLSGKSFFEEKNLSSVLNSKESKSDNNLGRGYTWYCESNDRNTMIWANFQDFNPNKELCEISVRRTCFYPSKPGINYITIRGFELSQAATQWAAPTAEQVGLIATHWNKGWIIENNLIHDSKCSGITLGKEKGTGHNVWMADISIDGSVHYIEVIFKALRNGWNKEDIGSHIVRHNEIYNCGQTGICGSFGAAFSLIEGNHIHDIYTKRQFAGSELAGIKFHGAIDAIIRRNRINNSFRGIWMDWMTQGVRISQNLLYDNDNMDMWFEVNHGPYLVDNNIFLSKVGLVNQSNGGAFVHNLFTGETKIWAEPGRYTPYQLPHSTEIAGVSSISSGDNRFYNNIFIGIGKGKGIDDVGIDVYGLSTFNDSLRLAWQNPNKRKIRVPSFINNNVYLNGAVPYKNEKQFVQNDELNPGIKLLDETEGLYLEFNLNKEDLKCGAKYITTETLGKTKMSKAAYENIDASSLIINIDYLETNFSNTEIVPGPFSGINIGYNKIKVW